MLYSDEWLMKFDGKVHPIEGCIFQPSDVVIGELVNSLEKYCSQYVYEYETDSIDFPKIKIIFKNENIPHLIGISRNHHYGLPTYHAIKMFEGLKEDWDLEFLMNSDEKWFDESQDKLIGALLLYKMLNLIETETYSTLKWGRIQHERHSRDNVYFVMLKDVDGKIYSLELAKEIPSEDWYFPRGMKINDTSFDRCEVLEIRLISKERIKKEKSKQQNTKRS